MSNYHKNFIAYMDYIINNKNYKGLAIKKKKDGSPNWIATANSKVGKERIKWADKKAKELGFDNSKKKYAKTMFSIHPTKKKVCQICGKTMDLHYIYPSKKTITYFENNFNYVYNKYDSIYDIVDKLPSFEKDIKNYLIKKSSLTNEDKDKNINDIISLVENDCRNNGKHIFSPGAMSNFPDRFDGFHTYNLCCRKEMDKGRHDNNMSTYNTDRRAYEFWSDGNIAAANQLMGDKSIFIGMSADHIGPISLGFKHDPLFIQPMSSSDNSSKRDRISKTDIEKLLKIEKDNNICPTSSFANLIWKFIKEDFMAEHSFFDCKFYRELLKQNITNFFESIWILLDNDENKKISNFLINYYFKPKYNTYFGYRYTFNEDGSIKSKSKRNFTKSSKNEFSRIIKKSFEAVYSYHDKSLDNRNNKPTLTLKEKNKLKSIRNSIINNDNMYSSTKKWEKYVHDMQNELISDWTE